MKASHAYRASNRYLKPTKEVTAEVGPGASCNVRMRLLTDHRTAFTTEMTIEEALELARKLQKEAHATRVKMKKVAAREAAAEVTES